MTSIDSNVLIGLLNEDDAMNVDAKNALASAARRGGLMVSAPAYPELCVMPKHEAWELDDVLNRSGIAVDWKMEEAMWREAGRANRAYVARRVDHRELPRRIAADFLIGAHALLRGYDLLTFDSRTFRSAFPRLKVFAV